MHGRVCPWLSRAGRQVKRPASVKIGCSPRYVVVSGCDYLPLAQGAKSSKVKDGPSFGRSPRCAMTRVPEPPIRVAFIDVKKAPCRSLTSCCASRSLSLPRCGFRTGWSGAAGKTRARRATSSRMCRRHHTFAPGSGAFCRVIFQPLRENWPISCPTLGQNRFRKRESGICTGLQSRLHQFDSGRRLWLLRPHWAHSGALRLIGVGAA
jgi:hypothetical protein